MVGTRRDTGDAERGCSDEGGEAVKDDPASIKLREEHREWSRSVGEADEAVEQIETIVAARPSSLFLRLMLSIARWAQRWLHKGEEAARIEARETYREH